MVACRVSEYSFPPPVDLGLNKADHLSSIPMYLRYDIALLYLQQSEYNLGLAVEAYKADEKWEKEHPLEGSSKGVKRGQKPGKRKIGFQTGLTGQL